MSDTLKVLVVCVANICRSPFLEFLLAQNVKTVAPDSSMSFSSAGLEAESGAAICQFAAKALQRLPDGEAFSKGFRSTRLTSADLEGAHLVLTASRGVRSAIAESAPRARPRIFTMLEAVTLAENLAKRNVRADDIDEVFSAPDMLPTLLHEQRGLYPTHPMRRAHRVTGLHEIEKSLDIPDVHTGQTRSHAEIQRKMKRAARSFAQTVAAMSRQSSEIS